jgi:hypothetical protein
MSTQQELLNYFQQQEEVANVTVQSVSSNLKHKLGVSDAAQYNFVIDLPTGVSEQPYIEYKSSVIFSSNDYAQVISGNLFNKFIASVQHNVTSSTNTLLKIENSLYYSLDTKDGNQYMMKLFDYGNSPVVSPTLQKLIDRIESEAPYVINVYPVKYDNWKNHIFALPDTDMFNLEYNPNTHYFFYITCMAKNQSTQIAENYKITHHQFGIDECEDETKHDYIVNALIETTNDQNF